MAEPRPTTRPASSANAGDIKNPASQGKLAGLGEAAEGEVSRLVWVDQGRDRVHGNGHCIRCVTSDHPGTEKFVNSRALFRKDSGGIHRFVVEA